MSKSTTIVTTTTALSNIADAIHADAETRGKLPTKQRMLNSAAKIIAGDKHDWGYLTGATGPVIQKGIPQRRLNDLQAAPQTHADAPTRPLWRGDRNAVGITVPAAPVALYDAEMAVYFKSTLQDGAFAISEDFSSHTEDEENAQCMFAPKVIYADEEEGFVFKSLWGATPDLINSAGRAYFAAAASGTVNDLISRHIMNWHYEAVTSSFMAFHMPHVLIITPDYPAHVLEDMDYADFDEERDEHVSWEHPVDAAFRVFIDETLDDEGMRQAAVEAEDFLMRLAAFFEWGNARWTNFQVTLPGDEVAASSAQNTGQPIKVISHVTSILHGGYEDRPGLTIWIDEEKGEAHLTGHSGSTTPLNGPIAPLLAPARRISGRRGECTTFDPEQISAAVSEFERIFSNYRPGRFDRYSKKIDAVFSELMDNLVPYRDWLAENEPETYAELYG